MLARLYRNCLLCWPLPVVALAPAGLPYALGAAAGGVVSLASLWSFERLVSRLERPRRLRLALALRYPLLFAAVFGVLQVGRVHPVGFCVGVGLVPAVMVAMAAKALVRGASL